MVKKSRLHHQSKVMLMKRLLNLTNILRIDDITANVKIKVRNDEQIIEVTVPTNDFTLRREESNSDLYAAIDLVIDKLER